MGRNYDLGLLRAIALDSGASPSRRLTAIDRLAVLSNTYNTAKIHAELYHATPARARRFIVKALRQLLKSPDLMACHASAIRERLLCIRGVESKHFWRLKPGTGTSVMKPEDDEKLTRSQSGTPFDVDDTLKRIEDEFYQQQPTEEKQ